MRTGQALRYWADEVGSRQRNNGKMKVKSSSQLIIKTFFRSSFKTCNVNVVQRAHDMFSRILYLRLFTKFCLKLLTGCKRYFFCPVYSTYLIFFYVFKNFFYHVEKKIRRYRVFENIWGARQ